MAKVNRAKQRADLIANGARFSGTKMAVELWLTLKQLDEFQGLLESNRGESRLAEVILRQILFSTFFGAA
jgi:hypothetical protein